MIDFDDRYWWFLLAFFLLPFAFSLSLSSLSICVLNFCLRAFCLHFEDFKSYALFPCIGRTLYYALKLTDVTLVNLWLK